VWHAVSKYRTGLVAQVAARNRVAGPSALVAVVAAPTLPIFTLANGRQPARPRLPTRDGRRSGGDRCAWLPRVWRFGGTPPRWRGVARLAPAWSAPLCVALAGSSAGCSSTGGLRRERGVSGEKDASGASLAIDGHDSPAPPSSSDPEGELQVGPHLRLLPLSRTELWATWNSLRGDAYELDAVERFLEDGQHPHCSPESLVRHAGTYLRYKGSVQVDRAFRERLVRFERVVSDLALEMYGRPPLRIQHFGAFSCRSSRKRSQRLSEHALGNAIDISGFDFSRASAQQPLPADAPNGLRRPFQIRVARHWNADSDDAMTQRHRRFLHELASRLSARSDVFRGMIGPSQSDHTDHFHFDMSPWRYVYF
jgi:hypothetical protein